MKKLIFPILALLLLSQTGFGQNNFTLSGYLRDGSTGEELLYGKVIVPELGTGVNTNEYGYYALTLPEGTYSVVYSYVGFRADTQTVNLNQDLRMDVELNSADVKMKEVVITDKIEDENVTSTEMSVITLDPKDAKLVPVLFGEQDIVKTLQLMPGVASASEGNAGFFVRGGEADQNLVLLDEAPVYNASHLLGFFSVFNSDALKDVKLYKGGIPAQYGGRASSVLDVRMKNGNTKKWEANGGIGLISSRLTVEGPLVKDKGSIMVSGRRTYADLMLKTFNRDFSDVQLYFYDLNLKANYNIGEKDRIYASGYFGRDIFKFAGNGLDWGNQTATLRWNHIFNPNLFVNTSAIYNDYDYGFGVQAAGNTVELSSGLYDVNLKQDYNWFINPKNTLKFGWNGIYHKFKPGKFSVTNEEDPSGNVELSVPDQQSVETGFYISNKQKVNDRLSLEYGLRASTFTNIGDFEVKTYDGDDNVLTTTQYDKWEAYNTAWGLAPRFSGTFLLDESSSLKASYNRNYQYLHLLSNSTSGTPTDVWIPSTPGVKPEYADQIAVGYFRNFQDNVWEMSVETFYKDLRNQVDYEDGAETFLNPDYEAELEFGKGRAYGAEFLLRKRKGKLTGWVSYSLLKSERQFDNINGGEWFSARQDRTHDLALVVTYQLNPKFTFSGTWVYYTGDAVTFPTGKYTVDGVTTYLYSERNGDRMPDYHRMDLGVTWFLKDRPHWASDLNLSVYNAYNRKNAYTITFAESTTNPGTTEATRTALFGVVPSLTWNFHFK